MLRTVLGMEEALNKMLAVALIYVTPHNTCEGCL